MGSDIFVLLLFLVTLLGLVVVAKLERALLGQVQPGRESFRKNADQLCNLFLKENASAAILKAYYLKRPHPDISKEVLTVSLNPDSTDIPYTLGRLFSVLEAVQERANPGINATIKDRYFNSASATPGHIFPILLNLSQKHLRKLEGGLRIYYEKQIAELMGVFFEEFPPRLNLPQQGAFQLGYYHQTQKRYEKKEENKDV